MPDDAFFALRNRAYELADTGRFKRWQEIASVLDSEGFLVPLITRLQDDKLAVMMIDRCCAQARSGA